MERRRFREGTVGQKAWFFFLAGVFLVGLGISISFHAGRIGTPDVGFNMDGPYVSPIRLDAADAGLRWGGLVLEVNGTAIAGLSYAREVVPLFRTEFGEDNILTVRRPTGAVENIRIPIREWRWADVVYAQGVIMCVGVLFFLVGLTSFLLRPFETGSWAMLSFCSLIGALLVDLFFLAVGLDGVQPLFFRALLGFVTVVPLHVALALPVIHPLLVRQGRRLLVLIYASGAVVSILEVSAWVTDFWGPLEHVGGLDTTVLLVTVGLFVGRCAVLAVRRGDPLVRQRARILLAGAAGASPTVLLRFAQNNFEVLVIDVRLGYWALCIMVLALAYTTVRHDLVNARIAVRRAVIYGVAMLLLTGVALLLITLRPYAVALLLLPLLYFWPRFDAWVTARLYPKRAQFPELARTLGEEMAGCTTTDEVLQVLASAPARLCDTVAAVAFLLPSPDGRPGHVAVDGRAPVEQADTLADEPLIQLMTTTRRDIFRESICVDPQYVHIRDECYACFERLHAEVLLPILRGNRVIGGLALGPRAAGDPYEPAELQAIASAAQQAVQAIVRAEATAQLRAREREFADLNRFLSPQIIEQVMERGGAAELRTQRKQVTVFFADLRGFTSFSDSVEPEEVMATLAEYHQAMGRRIEEYAGTLERFAGDGFMVFFNDPVEQADHVGRAVDMALAMREDIAQLRSNWTRKGYQIDVGMGIDTGYATCGFVGYEGRRDYSVIGNVTNLAARLSDAAAGGELVVTARVLDAVRDRVAHEPIGELRLKGFHQPQHAVRILGAAVTA